MSRKKMIGCRDPLGIRPLVLGDLDGAWILASETCALDIIGARFVREVENGEVIVISEEGVESLRPFPRMHPRPCVFEYVYFSRPDSILGGRFETGDGKNYSGMSDSMMDQLLAKARASYQDAERTAAYKDVQQRIYETAWYGTIWYRKYLDAFKKSIKGHEPTQEPDWGLRPAWIDR